MLSTTILSVCCALVAAAKTDASGAKSQPGKSLHQAAAAGDLEQVRLRIAEGADVNAEDGQGNTALHRAAIGGHKRVLEFLIAKGADLNAPGGFEATPLHAAAWEGHKDVVELLIAKGADVKALQGESRWTPLHSAACAGHEEVVELLLANGADIDAEDSGGWTALHYAVFSESRDMVKMLLAKGARVDVKGNWAGMLHRVAAHGNEAFAEVLVARGAKINERDRLGRAPLHHAARHGQGEVAKLLLAHGADVDLGDQDGRTALHDAALGGNTRVAEILISRGAAVDSKDDLGGTPLHYALTRGDDRMARLLKAKGADPGIAPIMRSGRPVVFESYQDIGALKVARQDLPGDVTGPGVEATVLTFSVQACAIKLYAAPEGYEYLRVADIKPLSRSGAPQIPMKTFVVKLDHDVQVLGVKVAEGQFATSAIACRIVPGESGRSSRYGVLCRPIEKIYESDDFFPGTLVRLQVGKDNTHTYAFIRFFPVQYAAKPGRLAVVTKAKLVLYYRAGPTKGMARSREPQKPSPDKQTTAHRVFPATDAQCIIICTNAVKAAARRLSQFHTREGITSEVVTVESIAGAYSPADEPPLGGGKTPRLEDSETIADYDNTLSMKIVAYLRDVSAHGCLEYVTILGDAKLVPPSHLYLDKGVYSYLKTRSSPSGKADYWVATDLFYASPDYDFVPNYKVGRLPINDNSEALEMTKKIENWFQHADWEWFRNVHLHGGLGAPKDAYAYVAREFENDLAKDLLSGMNVTKSLLSQGGSRHAVLESVLQKGNVGFVHHAAHAFDAGEGGYISPSDVLRYKATNRLPIVLASGCFTATWYKEYLSEGSGTDLLCIGEAILKSRAGGIAFLGSSGRGWDALHLYFDNGKVIVSKVAYTGGLFHYNIMKSYHEGADTLGKLASNAVFGFVSENDMSYVHNSEKVIRFTHLGDPALKIPVKPGQKHRPNRKP